MGGGAGLLEDVSGLITRQGLRKPLFRLQWSLLVRLGHSQESACCHKTLTRLFKFSFLKLLRHHMLPTYPEISLGSPVLQKSWKSKSYFFKKWFFACK